MEDIYESNKKAASGFVKKMDSTSNPKEKKIQVSVNDKGAFVHKESAFRNYITADGSSGFKAEAGRYHLYVSLACPWAHRSLSIRALKGLEDVISITVVDWLLDSNGWHFTDKKPKCSLDPLNGFERLRQVYEQTDPSYSGRVTVPTLYDKKENVIVNNESSEIIRMLNSEFQEFCETQDQRDLDFYPPALRDEIDEINSWVYPNINSGVYRCGFATSQEAYNEAIHNLFSSLDRAEEILSKKRYLTGSQLTEADIRLFVTLVRFDRVYHTLFKTNKKYIMDYPNLWGFTREIYQVPAVTATIDHEHIIRHYYESLLNINPNGIVPIGPTVDFLSPHGRERLS